LNAFNSETAMDLTFSTYLTYLLVSVALTVWVATTLSRNGLAFLVDVFRGSGALAASVNHLLVVGFYLLNFGFICLNLRLGMAVTSQAHAVELLSEKVGLVLLVLGGMHFANLWIFQRMRRRVLLEDAPPPVTPDELLTLAKAAPGTPS
jgi:hypothetical protein